MSTRTMTRSLIVHNDMAIGYGLVTQTRNDQTLAERQIELEWVFRTLDEIRYLDHTKYTRVSLHVANEPLYRYYFDSSSSAVDDGLDVLAPVPSVSNGRWIRVDALPKIFKSDTTNLEDATNEINTSAFKEEGRMVFNTVTNKPVWATGDGASDVWVDATGATAHTPV